MTDKERKARFLGHALTVSLLVTLILLIILLALTITWWVQRSGGFGATEQIICESCSALRFNHSLPIGCDGEIKGKVNDNDKCCCKASLVIDTLVKKSTLFDELMDTSIAAAVKSNCSERKIRGKVAGIDYKTLQDETRERDLVYFDKSYQSILESIGYTNGRFYISEPGYYYVFSQLMYAHDPESMKNIDARQNHTLYRYSFKHGKKEKLLENTRTFAQLHAPVNNSGTSFIGAVFKFDKDDEIMIKSTHTDKLTGEELENFFFLYMI